MKYIIMWQARKNAILYQIHNNITNEIGGGLKIEAGIFSLLYARAFFKKNISSKYLEIYRECPDIIKGSFKIIPI